MSNSETRVKVNVYLCKYHKTVNPVSRHIISSYSTCSFVSTIELEELVSILGEEAVAILRRNFEIDISDNEIVSKIINRSISENEYLKLSLD